MNRITEQDRQQVKELAKNYIKAEKSKRTKKKKEIDKECPGWFEIRILKVKQLHMLKHFNIKQSVYSNFINGTLKKRLSKSFTAIKKAFEL